jgi:hypothetical protein
MCAVDRTRAVPACLRHFTFEGDRARCCDESDLPSDWDERQIVALYVICRRKGRQRLVKCIVVMREPTTRYEHRVRETHAQS